MKIVKHNNNKGDNPFANTLFPRAMSAIYVPGVKLEKNHVLNLC